MPEYIINPDLVIRDPTAGQVQTIRIAEDVDAGESVFQDQTTADWFLTDASAVDKPPQNARTGVALSNGVAGQTISVQIGTGRIDIGGAGTVGDVVIASNNPGKMKLAGDLAAGEYLVLIGYIDDDGFLELFSNVTGVER